MEQVVLRSGSTARRIDTEALKRERPLADVVASYGIALHRESAGTYRALCPFHQEHTPSFWIDARDSSDEHYWWCAA
jgi:DNA primase